MPGTNFMASAALAALLAAGPAAASEVTPANAETLERTLTRYLPADLVEAGLVSVRAATTFYELRLDPSVLLEKAKSTPLTLTGVRPLTAYLHPTPEGEYRVEASDSLDIRGSLDTPAGKNAFSYLIRSMRLDGIYDPEILYFRSAEWRAGSLAFTSASPQQTVEARFGETMMRVDAEKKDGERLDITSSGVLRTFAETITGEQSGRVDIGADTVDIDVNLDGARYRALRDLVFFVLDNMHKRRLDAAEAARLKMLLRECMPVFDKLEETIVASNVTVGTQQGAFAARSVGYTIDMSGIAHSTRVGFGFSMEEPKPPAGLVPAAFESAVPRRAAFKAAVANLDLAGAVTYLLDRADFTAPQPLTDEESREIGRIVLPGGAMTIEFEDVSAVSAIYDVAMTGRMTVYPEEKGRQSADVTIVARDFDKTVAFLQQNAATVPQFGQAAFMLLMVKGFAQDQGDGSQRWDVAVGEDGKVLINGRPLPFQP